MLKAQSGKKKKYFLIPSLITYSNMILGTVAIFISNTSDIKKIKVSCLLILLAAITDKIDGFVARKLNMTSEFGKQLDSLCDLVSFGLAPVLVGWNIHKGYFNMMEIIMSIIFIGAGIFRLARFNITSQNRYIIGLPITISGAVLAVKYIIDINYRFVGDMMKTEPYENIILMIILSVLMISNFKLKKPTI